MRSLLRRFHRIAGLTLAALWGVQALTGIVMVFHWELDDAASVPSDSRLVTDRVGARVDALRIADAEWVVTSVYPTGGIAGHFDVLLDNSRGQTDSVRVDGQGRELERRPVDHDYRRAGLLRAATILHQSLFAGHGGRLIVGVSGLALLCNLVLGIRLAWPHIGQWRGVLRVPAGLKGAAGLYAWHRVLGLWLSVPALILVIAGCCLAFDDAWDDLLGTARPPTELAGAPPTIDAAVSTAQVLRSAFQQFPHAAFGGLILPTVAAPWYEVRLRQPGELRRVFGTTSVFVSAANGVVLARRDALHAGNARRFVDSFYSIHTGEAGGLAGRVVALGVGLWLATMIILGVSLWYGRRTLRRAAR